MLQPNMTGLFPTTVKYIPKLVLMGNFVQGVPSSFTTVEPVFPTHRH